MPIDPYEQATREFLEGLSLGKLQYEPNGQNTAPDFALGTTVAVEVTRLVKTTIVDGVRTNVTQQHPRTIASLRNVMERITDTPIRQSYFVNLRLQEPIDIQAARGALRQYLTDFLTHRVSQSGPVKICRGLNIDIDQANSPKETVFRLGSISGRDFVGWVGEELLNQCADAIERKAEIGRRIQPAFEEIWLAVGSHLTFGDMSEYVPLLQQHLPKQNVFQKLILLNSNRPTESQLLILQS